MSEATRQLFGTGLPLLAGYIFIQTSYYRRFKSEFLRTDRYAFRLLGHSLWLFVLGAVLAGTIPYWSFPQRFEGLRFSLEGIGFSAAVANSLMLAFGIAWLENWRVWYKVCGKTEPGEPRERKKQEFRLAALELFVGESCDATLRLLFRAAILRKRLMVTLKSGKVYVGEPVIPDFDPSSTLASVKLIPFLSGVRDAVTKKVNFTTNYTDIDELLVQKRAGQELRDRNDPLRSDMYNMTTSQSTVPVDIEDFGIVIPWCEVESATIFDASIYTAFQRQKSDSSPAQF